MLYVKMKSGVRGFAVWHVGEPAPRVNPDLVAFIRADGDELAFLSETGCPSERYGMTAVYRGESARRALRVIGGETIQAQDLLAGEMHRLQHEGPATA